MNNSESNRSKVFVQHMPGANCFKFIIERKSQNKNISTINKIMI